MTALAANLQRRPGSTEARRLLLVEDDANTRWVLGTLLRRVGYDCRAVADGAEALKAVGGFRPHAILMDLMMPVLDGLEATRRLKADAQTRRIPIVVLTGDATEGGESAARQAGCDAFLAKPIVLRDLLDRLDRHLGR